MSQAVISMRGVDGAGPIFIGGAARSGTSAMARLVRSHPSILLPAHENRLIVGHNGLRDLVDQLSGRVDVKRRHYAVAEFLRAARTLRPAGPDAPDGGAHYDRSVSAFVQAICANVANDGVVMAEGLIRPFITPRDLDRDGALRECRRFLDGLYAASMGQAAAARWCDATPGAWLHLDFLYALFPDMAFVHVIGDPREIVGDCLKAWAPSDPRAVVGILKAQFETYRRAKAAVPASSVLELRIEDIAADPGAATARMGAFLGVDARFDLDLFAPEPAGEGASADRLDDETKALVEAELADWMGEHGYLG